jgi:hypothetical protein
MTAPAEEIVTTPIEDIEHLLNPDEGHIVCCEDVTKTFCGSTIPEDDYSEVEPEPITCAPCLETEMKRGVAGCPKFVICAHAYCTPGRCNVRD